jgi:alpha-mannosidase
MRKFFRVPLFVAILVPISIAFGRQGGPTNVDRLVSVLDSAASNAYVEDWRVSPDLSTAVFNGDPTNFNFDDSGWKQVRLGSEIDADSCWMRTTFVLPETILGDPVRGRISLFVQLDNYGFMWINGESRGYFPFDKEFTLTNDARPGMKFVVAIKAVNGGANMHLLAAELRSQSISELPDTLRDLALSFRVGQKLLSFDTYQTNAHVKVDPHIDKSHMDRGKKADLNSLLQTLASRIDVDALRRGDAAGFMKSVNVVRPLLRPISDFAKQYTLYFVSNAHIDAAWLWRYKETIDICERTFGSVLNMMKVRPDMTYAQSAAAYYAWMQKYDPAVFNGIKERVKEGRWEVVGGMWIEPDCNLPSGESWMHQLLYSQRYFKNNLGVVAKIGWNPDSFGYTWNMPEFYLNAGIDAFITQKIGWNDTDVFPYRVFWWEAPDGSKILSYFPFDYVNQITDPYRLTDWMRQFEANSGFTKMMVLFGVGDHGGGPSLEMMKRIDRLKTLDIYPKVEFGTAGNYISWLKDQNLSKLPVWDSELYLEYHRGTFTTQSETSDLNRESEELLTNAEKFSTVATMYGRKYDNASIEKAWQEVMFNQFHDILPGSGIRENYIDAAERYRIAKEIGTHELDGSFSNIDKRINTLNVKGRPVVVYNPLSWERSDVVRVPLPESFIGDYSVYDVSGKEVPSQIVDKGLYSREILFIASGVPSMGYRVYDLRNIRPRINSTGLEIDSTTIENQFYKVTVDHDSGWVKGIFDKKNGREVLTGFGNRLQVLEDKPKQWDAWNIGLTRVEYPTKFRKIEVVEKGPVRVVLRVYRDLRKPGEIGVYPTDNFPTSFFKQDIILYNGIDRVDFRTNVDWWETHTMLKVAFPVNVRDSLATFEIPYGTIGRATIPKNSWDEAKWEVPAERWADMSEKVARSTSSGAGFGVSLLNNSKYGYDIKGSVMRLSLLRSPVWPDPTADRGKHTIDYAIYSHSGTWKSGGTEREGYDFNNPLIASISARHSGPLPSTYSFFRLSPSNLVLTIVKQAEDSKAWVVEWYDASGKDSQADLLLPRRPKKVVESNFLEEDGKPIPFKGNHVFVDTKKNSIKTIKVYF